MELDKRCTILLATTPESFKIVWLLRTKLFALEIEKSLTFLGRYKISTFIFHAKNSNVTEQMNTPNSQVFKYMP